MRGFDPRAAIRLRHAGRTPTVHAALPRPGRAHRADRAGRAVRRAGLRARRDAAAHSATTCSYEPSIVDAPRLSRGQRRAPRCRSCERRCAHARVDAHHRRSRRLRRDAHPAAVGCGRVRAARAAAWSASATSPRCMRCGRTRAVGSLHGSMVASLGRSERRARSSAVARRSRGAFPSSFANLDAVARAAPRACCSAATSRC